MLIGGTGTDPRQLVYYTALLSVKASMATDIRRIRSHTAGNTDSNG